MNCATIHKKFFQQVTRPNCQTPDYEFRDGCLELHIVGACLFGGEDHFLCGFEVAVVVDSGLCDDYGFHDSKLVIILRNPKYRARKRGEKG